jgi:hypothetical protein
LVVPPDAEARGGGCGTHRPPMRGTVSPIEGGAVSRWPMPAGSHRNTATASRPPPRRARPTGIDGLMPIAMAQANANAIGVGGAARCVSRTD